MKKINHLIQYSAVAIIAALISSTDGQAQAEKFQISNGVYNDFKKYLDEATTTNNSAFAVTPHGIRSYSVHCADAGSCQPIDDVLKKCREDSHEKCVIFAKDKNPEIEFEVIELFSQLDKNDPIMLHILNEDELKRTIVGNTISGYYLNKIEWSEYYAPDGEIHGRPTSMKVRYIIKDGRLCYNREPLSSYWCVLVSREGDHLKFITGDGKLQGYFVDAWVLPGQN